MFEHHAQAKEFFQPHGFNLTQDIIWDGAWHEVTDTGPKYSYVATKNARGNYRITVKSFALNNSWTWKSHANVQLLTPEEKVAKKKERTDREDAISNATNILFMEACPDKPSGVTYIHRKWPTDTLTLPPFPHNWKKDINHSFMLMVPMCDETGKIWNIQTIQADGTKRAMSGKKKGLFCIVGDSELGDTVHICEGLSTAWTIYEATKMQTLCAFGVDNIPHVINRIKKIVKNIVVVVDNDWEKKDNAGLLMVEHLKKAFTGLQVCIPTQGLLQSGESDYNDILMQKTREPAESLELIREDLFRQIHYPPKPESQLSMNENTTVTQSSHESIPQTPSEPVDRITSIKKHMLPYKNGLDVLPLRTDDSGKKIPYQDTEVAHYLMRYWEGKLVRYKRDFFHYNDSHWVEMDDSDRSNLYRQIMVALNGEGGDKKIAGILKIFYNLVPVAPRDLLIPNPYCINFTNGTLHVLEQGLEFRAKNKLDYCINTIPIDYDPTRQIRNEMFDEMIKNILGGDTDQLRIIKQMYGACLAPIYPRLFMLLGRKGSGKSSLIKGAMALVDQRNFGSLQPKDFKDPYLSTLIGKLVNAVTDLDEDTPVEDSIVKQIEDRVPITMNRKYKDAVALPLPAVHIFGGNSMPPTRSGRSMAHTRRWSFVKIEKFDSEGVHKDIDQKDYATKAVRSCPTGVLNFALEGLEDLLKSEGRYFASKESVEMVEEWQNDNSPLYQFLNACREGECFGLVLQPDSWAKRSEIWRTFKDWHLDALNRKPALSRCSFFKFLYTKKYTTRISRGEWEFSGFAFVKDPAASSLGGVKESTPLVHYSHPDTPF